MMEECIAYLDGEGAWHVVPHEKVIRCKYCKFWDTHDGQYPDIDGRKLHRCSEMANELTDEYHFCGWAERKEE